MRTNVRQNVSGVISRGSDERWQEVAWYTGVAVGWAAIEVGLASLPWLNAPPAESAVMVIGGVLLAAASAFVTFVCLRLGAPARVANAIAIACAGIAAFILLVSWTPVVAQTAVLQFTTLGAQLLALAVAPTVAAYAAARFTAGKSINAGPEVQVGHGSA